MNRRAWSAVAVVSVLASLFVGTPALAAQGRVITSGEVVPDSYIVVLRDGVAATASGLATTYGGTVTASWQRALNGYSARMSADQASRLAADPRVAYVQQDQVVKAADIQSDPPSWGLDRIDQRDRAPDRAYAQDTAAADVRAYVIDTGIRTTHSTFGGRASWGVNTIDSTDTDCHGHGTHVAGTVGGAEFGVAKGVLLTAVKVLDCYGNGTVTSVISGVEWVTLNASKPAVANMSLGIAATAAIDTAVANSIASGVTYAVASGNDDWDACQYSPARVPTAITVNASDITDFRAAFSNYGTCTDVFAPGVGITSAGISDDKATAQANGTSMAAPHVAGAAALWLAQHPDATPAQVSAAVITAASPDRVGDPGPGSPNRLLFTAPGGGIAGRPWITNPGRQSGGVGTAVDLPLRPDGGAAPYTWSATGLPAGLSIAASTGRISGTPTTPAIVRATVTLTDAGGRTATTAFEWIVLSPARQTVRNGATGQCLTPLGTSMDRNVGVVQFTCDVDPGRQWSAIPSPLGGYFVQNAKSGLCLTPAGGTSRLGEPTVQYNCDGHRSRTWRIVRSGDSYHLKNLHSGLCAASWSGDNRVVQHRCDTQSVALWQLTEYPVYPQLHLRNAGTGLCPTPASRGTVNNVEVVQYACDVDPSRRWSLVPSPLGGYFVQNLDSGLCLTPAGGSAGLNVVAVQYFCDNAPSRRWTQVASGTSIQLRNVHSTLCLTADTATSRLVQFTCDTDPVRLWQPIAYPTYPRLHVRNAHSGLCLTPVGAGVVNNVEVVQHACDVDPARRWSLVPSPLGGYFVQNAKSGLCLTPAGGSAGVNVVAVQYFCDNVPSRRWTQVTSGTAIYLRNVHSNLCLTTGTATNSGSPAFQFDCDSHPARLWRTTA